MLTLYHHSFCPNSRAVRLALGEYGLFAKLVEIETWRRDADFLALNPANTTPVLMLGGATPIVGVRPVLDYLDEVHGEGLGENRLMPSHPETRAEVRRLVDWFTDGFGADVTEYLVGEKLMKRYRPSEMGGGPPDTQKLKAGSQNLHTHLKYIAFLAMRRNWLAGDRLSHADLVAAAHLSTVDYLGDVPWDSVATAKDWYARIKSRPCFRPVLSDRAKGLMPAPVYADLDF
ncbi:MAG: glutathione S-transferase family protein [Pseudomonadota bacterium]